LAEKSRRVAGWGWGGRRRDGGKKRGSNQTDAWISNRGRGPILDNWDRNTNNKTGFKEKMWLSKVPPPLYMQQSSGNREAWGGRTGDNAKLETAPLGKNHFSVLPIGRRETIGGDAHGNEKRWRMGRKFLRELTKRKMLRGNKRGK